MPDWPYHPLFKPVLLRLPPVVARDLTLNSLGLLTLTPFGGALIEFFGHMRSDPRLRQTLAGLTFPTRVGLGVGIDNKAVALPALARMGLGFLEVGPVIIHMPPTMEPMRRGQEEEAIHYGDDFPAITVDRLLEQLRRAKPLTVPLLIRLPIPIAQNGEGNDPSEQAQADAMIMARLADHAAAFTVTATLLLLEGEWSQAQWQQYCQTLLAAQSSSGRQARLLLWIPANTPPAQAVMLIAATEAVCEQGKFAGIVIGGLRCAPISGENTQHISLGLEAFLPACDLLATLAKQTVGRYLLIASAGIHEPAQALHLLACGANLVQVDSGLVYSGPGLPKRINEAVLYESVHAQRAEPSNRQLPTTEREEEASQPTAQSWFWTLMLGFSMMFGGLLALVIAATRVLLPYDEMFVGMLREQMAAINAQLLPFLTHDRITLAGVMVALGIFYSALSWFAIRRGHHWAKVTVLTSALVGFASFFLFLGFGYFDPFHAFVSAILFQFLLLGLQGRLPPYLAIAQPSLYDDWRWRWSLWGQLLFVLQGIAIIGAGLVIATIGISQVFVAEDLEFLQTTTEVLQAANPFIVPLVAHDRATLGGMLLSSGLAILLSALWGYRPGERWLWWAFVLGCAAAYSGAIGVHLQVGYLDWVHLAPAWAGVVMSIVAAWLSYPFLCQSGR